MMHATMEVDVVPGDVKTAGRRVQLELAPRPGDENGGKGEYNNSCDGAHDGDFIDDDVGRRGGSAGNNRWRGASGWARERGRSDLTPDISLKPRHPRCSRQQYNTSCDFTTL